MAKFGKWIGGGLGWAFGGPIGALIGYAVGSMLDSAGRVEYDTYTQQARPRQTTAGDFGVSLLVLSAAVMKADGKVLKSELAYVKQFFERQFGKRSSAEHMLLFKEILKQDVDVAKVCMQIRNNIDISSRLQLLHYLFGIAKADGHVDMAEVDLIEKIAGYLNIGRGEFVSIKAMFFKNSNTAYKILDLDPKATDAELKKAYRKMAVKYHPDKLGHLGDDFKKASKEKFLKVKEAYETIKKERGIN
ncbi:MAG: TerB family tellurite resistance protein [Flavobacteriales bacterium]|nr:TerB family tellurite resistance protein [Flavobacteriales bacterium]